MSETPTTMPTSSLWPTSSPWPTASATPTGSPFPTSSSWPTASGTPTSSPFPTASGTPTASPFPTMSLWPTASGTPTSSPFPTASGTPTASPYPTASGTPTQSPFPTWTQIPTANVGETKSSVGYSHSCNNFKSGQKGHVETDIIFTYIAEAKTSSTDFMTDLELHLMDHAASESLECFEGNALHVYRIGYPENGAASVARPCEVSHPEAIACWILQTHMLVISDASSALTAKENLLTLLDLELTDGALAEEDFPELVHTEYLGPDPVDSALIADGAGLNPTNGGNGDGNTDTVLLAVAIASAVLAILSLVAFVGLFFYVRRKKTTFVIDEYTGGEDGRGTETLEISELLHQSRQRLQEVTPISSSKNYGYDNDDDKEEVYQIDVAELMTTKEGRRALKRDLTKSSYRDLKKSSGSEHSKSSRQSSRSKKSTSSRASQQSTIISPRRSDNELAVPASPTRRYSKERGPQSFRQTPENVRGSATTHDHYSLSSSSSNASSRKEKQTSSLYDDPNDGSERILKKKASARSSSSGKGRHSDYHFLSSSSGNKLDPEGDSDGLRGRNVV